MCSLRRGQPRSASTASQRAADRGHRRSFRSTEGGRLCHHLGPPRLRRGLGLRSAPAEGCTAGPCHTRGICWTMRGWFCGQLGVGDDLWKRSAFGRATERQGDPRGGLRGSLRCCPTGRLGRDLGGPGLRPAHLRRAGRSGLPAGATSRKQRCRCHGSCRRLREDARAAGLRRRWESGARQAEERPTHPGHRRGVRCHLCRRYRGRLGQSGSRR
mmetsp:Transcript_72251/g.172514  ORF Transcript_72251/g.172514 Transcript_72251/m.172514 type:complete len:214 (-) Transcript_72251:62-703(-)